MLAKLLSGAGGAGRPQPTFVSSSIGAGGGSGVTVTAPASIQNGDLLVALLYVTGASSSTVVAPPTGFNAQSRQDSSETAFCFATKVAASESGNYTFSVSGTSANTVGAILVYRNATSVNTIGALTIAASNTVAAASITPTYAGTLVAAYVRTGSGSPTISSAPSGMTLRGSFLSSNPTFAVYDQSGQAAAATGTRSITWNGPGTPESAGILLQVTNEPNVTPVFVASATQGNSANTIAINKPTGTVEGDFMVATVSAGSNSPVYTAPAGWTTVADAGGTNPCTIVAYKTAGASEPASYTFTADKTQNNSGAIVTYRYAAYDTIAARFNKSANPLVLTSISPSSSQSLLLAIAARSASSVEITTPTSMNAVVTDANPAAPSYIICDQKVAKGPTGTRSTTTGGTTYVAGIMLAIKPTRSLT